MAPDTLALAGARVTIHRVDITGGAPLDSALTDRRGAYTFSGVAVDTMALFVVSTDHSGIAYFTSPVSLTGDSAGLAGPLLVYDTSSVGPPIGTFQRHVIVSPTEDGENIGVLEMVIVDNPGGVTRVVGDSVSPVWVGRIPPEAAQFRAGEGEINSASISRLGDVVMVMAPIPPGRRQIIYSYVLPRGIDRVELNVGQAVGQMNVLVDTRSGGILSGGLIDLGRQDIGTQTYRHYEGAPVAAGLRLEIRFPGSPMNPADTVPWIAGFVALAMVAVLTWRMRSVPVPEPASPTLDASKLAQRVAALDRQFETLKNATHEQRVSYEERRARLKEILARALANAG